MESRECHAFSCILCIACVSRFAAPAETGGTTCQMLHGPSPETPPVKNEVLLLPARSLCLTSGASPLYLRSAIFRIEKALRRFRKAANNCGHLRILRNRKTFECAHDKKIRKAKESAMRLARARRSARSRAAAGF